MPTGVYKPVSEAEAATRLRSISTDAGGAVATAATPTSGTIALTARRYGPFFELTFTLTAARIAITDGAGSGSYGSQKLCDFPQYAVSFLDARQDYTAFAEGAALTTAAGDASSTIDVTGTINEAGRLAMARRPDSFQ